MIGVLYSKHPEIQVLDLEDNEFLVSQPYPLCPDPVTLYCNIDVMEAIAPKLNRAVGLDSVDAAMAKAIMTVCGRSSAELQEELVEWAEWLANMSPPPATYCGMMVR